MNKKGMTRGEYGRRLEPYLDLIPDAGEQRAYVDAQLLEQQEVQLRANLKYVAEHIAKGREAHAYQVTASVPKTCAEMVVSVLESRGYTVKRVATERTCDQEPLEIVWSAATLPPEAHPDMSVR